MSTDSRPFLPESQAAPCRRLFLSSLWKVTAAVKTSLSFLKAVNTGSLQCQGQCVSIEEPKSCPSATDYPFILLHNTLLPPLWLDPSLWLGRGVLTYSKFIFPNESVLALDIAQLWLPCFLFFVCFVFCFLSSFIFCEVGEAFINTLLFSVQFCSW